MGCGKASQKIVASTAAAGDQQTEKNQGVMKEEMKAPSDANRLGDASVKPLSNQGEERGVYSEQALSDCD